MFPASLGELSTGFSVVTVGPGVAQLATSSATNSLLLLEIAKVDTIFSLAAHSRYRETDYKITLFAPRQWGTFYLLFNLYKV